MKKEVTFGNLLVMATLFVGGLIAFHVRIAINEERNDEQDLKIQDNTEEMRINDDKREKDRNEIQLKLDRIIENQNKG